MLVALELPMVYAESIVYWDYIDEVWELNSQAFSFSVPKLWGRRKSIMVTILWWCFVFHSIEQVSEDVRDGSLQTAEESIK